MTFSQQHAAPDTGVFDPRFTNQNRTLIDAVNTHGLLICAHRGSFAGNIMQNTAGSAAAAWLRGAHIVELDVVETTDGQWVCFHDHYEKQLFNESFDIREASFEKLAAIPYFEKTEGFSPARVNTVEELFQGGDKISSGALLYSIDRCWDYWERFLPYLASLPQAGRCLLKSPVTEKIVDALAASPVPFAYLPIVKTVEEFNQVTAWADERGLNLAGYEFIADTVEHPFLADGFFDAVHAAGRLVLLNGLNLGNGQNLSAGFDDDVSLFTGPEHGWGMLMAYGADIIQTDWPDMLSAYVGRKNS